MKRSRLLIILGAILLASCTSTMTTQTVKTMDIYGPGVIHHPVIADLEVRNTKVTESTTGSSSNVEALKRDVVNKAVKSVGADLLVEPVYEVQSTGSRVVVTVSGYPASYKNFRAATQADLPMMEAGILHKAEKAEVTTTPAKKKGPGGAIFVTLLIVGAILFGALGGA